MIGLTYTLNKEQNNTLWMIICILNFANIFPMIVFKNFFENLNNVIANAFLFWISCVFFVLQA